MALVLTTFQTALQSKLDGFSGSVAIDDFMVAAKAVHEIQDSLAVSDVQAAGTTQVTAINTAGTTKVAAVNAAGDAKIAEIGTITGGGATNAAGLTFAPAGNISATNTQAAIVELDNEKAPKASPVFTGIPEVPTASVGTSTPQAASTQFVQNEKPVAATVAEIATGTSATKFISPKGQADFSAPLSVPYAGTVQLDLNTRKDFEIGALTGSLALANFQNMKPGDRGMILFTQDSTGNRVVTPGNQFVKLNQGAWATTAGSKTMLSYIVWSSSVIYYTLSKV
jgi:hypothetical protein